MESVLSESKFSSVRIFEIQSGTRAKNTTLGPPTGSKTRDLANAMLLATAFALQLAGNCNKFARQRAQLRDGGPRVALFATSAG